MRLRYFLPFLVVWSLYAEDLPGMRLRQDHKCFVRKSPAEAYHEETVTAHGTCFAIGKRLLLTVAHNVIAGDNKVEAPRIEYNGKWNLTKVLYMDEELDLALLATETDVPKVVALAEKPAQPADKVIMYGSFGGAEIDATKGTIARRYWCNRSYTLASLPFGHGNSGAPLLKDGKVVGIADAGIPADGDIRKDMGLFIPVEVIKYFLETYNALEKGKRK